MNPPGCRAYIISKKLNFPEYKFRIWAKENYGNLNIQKKSLLAKLDSLDSINEIRPFSIDEVSRRSQIQQELFFYF